jgi:hypothetical protein
MHMGTICTTGYDISKLILLSLWSDIWLAFGDHGVIIHDSVAPNTLNSGLQLVISCGILWVHSTDWLIKMGWDYVSELRPSLAYLSSPGWYVIMECHGGDAG